MKYLSSPFSWFLLFLYRHASLAREYDLKPDLFRGYTPRQSRNDVVRGGTDPIVSRTVYKRILVLRMPAFTYRATDDCEQSRARSREKEYKRGLVTPVRAS